jgi:hypothetical protein
MMFLSTIRATVLLLALPTLPPKYGWLIIGFTPTNIKFHYHTALYIYTYVYKYQLNIYLYHISVITPHLPIIYPICPYIIQSPNK